MEIPGHHTDVLKRGIIACWADGSAGLALACIGDQGWLKLPEFQDFLAQGQAATLDRCLGKFQQLRQPISTEVAAIKLFKPSGFCVPLATASSS